MRKNKGKEADSDFEEITFTCPNCGKEIKMIKLKGLNTEGMLCQQCSKGEVELDTG